MPALFVLVSIVAAASLAIFVLHLRGERADWTGAHGEHFIGSGTWCLGMGEVSRASWPLVRLDIRPSGLLVGPTSRWLGWLVPRVEMRWADISWVERLPTGVRINLKSADHRALLFQLHRDAVLAALRAYPIELRS
jgi:hypothetical protein